MNGDAAAGKQQVLDAAGTSRLDRVASPTSGVLGECGHLQGRTEATAGDAGVWLDPVPVAGWLAMPERLRRFGGRDGTRQGKAGSLSGRG